MNKKILIFVLLVILAIGAYALSMHSEISVGPSPLVDRGNMVNERGEHVDRFVTGTFKIKGTNESFSYRERDNNLPVGKSIGDYNDNAVNDCVKIDCRTIYFIDDTYSHNGPQKLLAVFNDKNTFFIGEIIDEKFTVNNKDDNAIYTIEYIENGKTKTVQYIDELCRGVKGGGMYCRTAASYKNSPVIFQLNKDGSIYSTLESGKILETELVSYQYSTIPDTGEIFPIIQR